MTAEEGEAEARARLLRQWRQGDYSTTITEIILATGLEDGTAVLAVDAEEVQGLVVVTQTCDIINEAAGKEYVVVCPLRELKPEVVEEVRKGRSPSAVLLDNPPAPNVVVDLGRMMSLHKSVLVRMERREGYSTDEGRTRLAEALERKHGRFAFPDAFNDDVLAKLRSRILGAHGKETSDYGKAYRSIRTARVTAFPSWEPEEGEKVEVLFHFVLHPEKDREATREAIAKALDEHLKKIEWPTGYKPGNPSYQLVLMEDMTAAEWTQSQPIDWDFISSAGRLIAQDKL